MKNKGFAIITALALIAGILVGAMSDMLCGYSITQEGFTEITKDSVIELSRRMCIFDVVVFMLIAVSGFTLFVKPVSAILMLLRGIPLGMAISYLKSTGEISYLLIIPAVTYTAATLMLFFFSQRAGWFFKLMEGTKGFTAKTRESLGYVFISLTFTGAAILTRVLPLIIFR